MISLICFSRHPAFLSELAQHFWISPPWQASGSPFFPDCWPDMLVTAGLQAKTACIRETQAGPAHQGVPGCSQPSSARAGLWHLLLGVSCLHNFLRSFQNVGEFRWGLGSTEKNQRDGFLWRGWDIYYLLKMISRASLEAHLVKNLPAMQETQFWFLRQGRSPEEGNDNLLQYFVWTGGPWWATVHGVAKNWTWLSN